VPVERKSTWSRLTLPLHQVLRWAGRAFLVCLLSIVLGSVLQGQESDPSDIFLKAYLSAQQGEKLEQENRFKAALAKFRFAGSLIEELRRAHSDWQPAIVEYRGRKIGEGILRVQERITRHNELAVTASPLPEVVPSLPEDDSWSEPGPEVVAPQGLDTFSQGSSDGAIEEATKKLRRKVDQLQAALEKSRSDLETARKEKKAINTRLEETNFKLDDAQTEIETSKQTERQVRDQLAQTQASLKALQSSQENSAIKQLRAENAHLKDAVTVAEEARATAERQREEATEKLSEANQQIAAVEQQRDEALAQLKAAGQTEQATKTIFANSGDLKLMLANAKDNSREIHEGNAANAEELREVQQQVTRLQQQLAESEKQNQYLVARTGELWAQLDETGAQLRNANVVGKNNAETDRLMRENELLRNIVVRERQEEARRNEVRKLMLAELGRLKIKSAELSKEIEFLARPVTKLSTEELTLLRQPVVSVSDQSRGSLTASFIFAKKSTGDSVEGDAATNNPGRLKGDVRDDPQDVAHAATESFSGASGERPKPGNPDHRSE
jgi:myosin heavy subunit